MRENDIEVNEDMINEFVAFAAKRQDKTSPAVPESQESSLPEASTPMQDSRSGEEEPSSRITSASVNRVPWGTP